MKERFGDSQYDNKLEELSCLQQMSIVTEYMDQLEAY